MYSVLEEFLLVWLIVLCTIPSLLVEFIQAKKRSKVRQVRKASRCQHVKTKINKRNQMLHMQFLQRMQPKEIER